MVTESLAVFNGSYSEIMVAMALATWDKGPRDLVAVQGSLTKRVSSIGNKYGTEVQGSQTVPQTFKPVDFLQV